MSEGALFNLRVLDLTHYIAGPYCTKLMADMGADVIKVERPDGGDPARRMGPFPEDVPDPEKSGLFLYLNTSKKGITLNLKTETGRKTFKELVRDVDILVENFEPRVMPSLGLDYEALEKINPKLVMTSISNFGQTGPYRDYKAQEITELALGGLMYLTGDADREPLKQGGSVVQFSAGTDGLVASLAAFFSAEVTGAGQHIDVSIMEAVVTMLSPAPIRWYNERIPIKRNNNFCSAREFKGGAGQGIYPCRDGYVGVEIPSLALLQSLGAMSGVEGLLDPDIGYYMFGKAANTDKLHSLLMDWCREHTREEIYHTGQDARLPFGRVHDIEELWSWPQYRERGFWGEVDHPVAGRLTYPARPFVMSQTPLKQGRAPLLGEHNEEILGDRLGYSQEDLVRLRETGII